MSIQEKLRALKNMSECPGATENEVKVALTKIRQLMRKYNIKEIEEEIDKIGQVSSLTRCGFHKWEMSLSVVAGIVTDCKSYVSYINKGKTGGKATIYFAGFEEDRNNAVEIFMTLLHVTKGFARNFCGEGWNNKHISYSLGFVSGLYAQVAEDKRNDETAIILRKDLEVNNWLEKNLKLTRPKDRPTKVNSDIYNKGFVDGNEYDVNRKGLQ